MPSQRSTKPNDFPPLQKTSELPRRGKESTKGSRKGWWRVKMKKGNAFHRKLEPKRQTEKFYENGMQERRAGQVSKLAFRALRVANTIV